MTAMVANKIVKTSFFRATAMTAYGTNLTQSGFNIVVRVSNLNPQFQTLICLLVQGGGIKKMGTTVWHFYLTNLAS
jgi:hypothetical protein